MAARYLRGDNVRIEADIADSEAKPVAATPIVITIFDPHGNAVLTDTAMTASAVTGTYYYNRQTVVTDLVGYAAQPLDEVHDVVRDRIDAFKVPASWSTSGQLRYQLRYGP